MVPIWFLFGHGHRGREWHGLNMVSAYFNTLCTRGSQWRGWLLSGTLGPHSHSRMRPGWVAGCISLLCLPRWYLHGWLGHSHKPNPRLGWRTREITDVPQGFWKMEWGHSKKTIWNKISLPLLGRGAWDSPASPCACISFQGALTSISQPPLPPLYKLASPSLHSCHAQGQEIHSFAEKKKDVDVLPGLKSQRGKKIPAHFLVESTEAISEAFLNINIIMRRHGVLLHLWVLHNNVPQQDLLEPVTPLRTSCSSRGMLTFVVY